MGLKVKVVDQRSRSNAKNRVWTSMFVVLNLVLSSMSKVQVDAKLKFKVECVA